VWNAIDLGADHELNLLRPGRQYARAQQVDRTQ
jgi:hypothetical protein